MVQARVREQAPQAHDHSRLGIACPEDDAPHASQNERAGTHGAWLQGHVQGSSYPPVAGLRRGRAKGQQLGVRARVGDRTGRVPTHPRHFPAHHENSAHRHLSLGTRGSRFGECQRHPAQVVLLTRLLTEKVAARPGLRRRAHETGNVRRTRWERHAEAQW